MKTLVLDLDETLVHSTFDYVENYDLVIPIEIEGSCFNIYVSVRPGAFEFIEELSDYYEIVIFTASLSKVKKFIY
jgi:RNA polymerase II subunit A small phosphatase-like protein